MTVVEDEDRRAPRAPFNAFKQTGRIRVAHVHMPRSPPFISHVGSKIECGHRLPRPRRANESDQTLVAKKVQAIVEVVCVRREPRLVL
jgi:hypothetical protein